MGVPRKPDPNVASGALKNHGGARNNCPGFAIRTGHFAHSRRRGKRNVRTFTYVVASSAQRAPDAQRGATVRLMRSRTPAQQFRAPKAVRIFFPGPVSSAP